MPAAKFGGDLDRKNDMGETALHLTAASRNVNAVTLLLEFGAGIDQKDREGKTPLSLALERGDARFRRKLIDFDANVEPCMETRKISLT